MTRTNIFWVLMLIWFVFALVINFGGRGVFDGYYEFAGVGNTFLFFILFALLGWQVYGPPIRGG